MAVGDYVKDQEMILLSDDLTHEDPLMMKVNYLYKQLAKINC